MAKSIITPHGEYCFICGRRATEKHHIFGGPNRRLSEKYGLTVPLCHWCHNEPPNGVHFNREADLELKKLGQARFQSTYRDLDFLAIFGRRYYK